ncbi:DJ-1/PfpI/YhbO family deglycase/protease [Gluconacetobacter azotocaptans]|uniref:DJ-1/PfpI/YhbO family deglycase/protease n=2 Tax=Gluconacetobacter azotocaptans TaxID=142834 RepID=A0A7W4JQ68_9PROT|nr:DJ-1/PfpI/YhbO family deglycase/protease [Gluconacetobacter azotocaptans]GBQ30988.1 protease I [Gluconacetobacter azotocaptans DSM 13594]
MTDNPLDFSPLRDARIRAKARLLWQEDGCPDGGDAAYLEAARALVGMTDSAGAGQMRPSDEPEGVEDAFLQDNLGEFPSRLTDQGDDRLVPFPTRHQANMAGQAEGSLEGTLMGALDGRTIAILATDGVEEVELTEPVKALRDAGARTVLVALHSGQIQAMKSDVTPTRRYDVDLPVAEAEAAEFDGLVLPGGTTSPDHLRMDDDAVRFVREFVQAGKPIAAICHGPWTLIDAGGVNGHVMTSWRSLRADLTNAGAHWVDESVVTDGTLVTSRNPGDLKLFCPAIVTLFSGVAAAHPA